MKLYCIRYHHEDEGTLLLWAESRALALKAKVSLEHAAKLDGKLSNIKLREYDLALTKRSLVGFLNYYFRSDNDQ